MELSRYRRGQLFGADMILALLIFGSAVAMVTQLADVQPRMGEAAAVDARRALSILATQPGLPLDWNSTNVKLPGLAPFPFYADENRIARFLGLNTSWTKEALGVDQYGFYLEGLWLNGSVATANGTSMTKGTQAPSNSTMVAVAEELVRYKSTQLRLRVQLYLPRP